MAGVADRFSDAFSGDCVSANRETWFRVWSLEETPGTGRDEVRACLVTSRGISIRVSLLGVLAGAIVEDAW